MNSPDERQIENLLRAAPRPEPPEGLKQTLIMHAQPSPSRSSLPLTARAGTGWLRRWWPALLPAGFSLACAAVVAVQQNQIQELKQSIQTLSTATPAGRAVSSPAASPGNAASASGTAEQQQQEIAQLREQVATLSAQIAQLEKLRADNQQLRSRLAAPPADGLPAADAAALEAARERAMRIACVNNLKQLGLAAKLWAGDNNDVYPTDIVCMSNEMNTPKILVCPADAGRQPAPDFRSYTDANCSYEWFLSPPGSDAEPTRVLTRCPIHGNVGLYDGSVQMVGTNHPDWFVQRDGKLYLERPGSGQR